MSKVPLVIRNKFVPAAYKLHLDIVPSKPNFQAQLEIHLVDNANYAGSQQELELSLDFHCSNIIVTSAVFQDDHSQVSEKANVKYNRDLELVTLSVANSAESESHFHGLSSFKIVLNYVGKIASIKTYKDQTVGVFKTNYLNGLTGKADNYIISTHCQPKFARLIFPCVDELPSKPTFELSIKTDIRYTCVANAPETRTEIVDDVKKIVHFLKTPPMTPSVFGFVVGDLEYVEQKVKMSGDKEVPVRVYTPIGELENSSYPLNVAALSLPELEKLLHHPFPLDKIDFVALPFLSDSAMEDWGLVQVQQSYLLIEPELVSKKESEPQLRSLREVIVHELVHQWVGNAVTFDDWSHLWLNEAFATFLAYALLSKLNLTASDKAIWAEKCTSDFQKYLDQDSLPNLNPIFVRHALEVKTTQDALSQDAYYKGIPLLRSLANTFNNNADDDFSVFFEMVGEFMAKWEFKSFKPVDLWNSLTKSPLNLQKIDVSSFMHSWTRLPGYPILQVSVNEHNKVQITQHRYIYGLKVEEDDSFEDVPYHVPITCRLSSENGTTVVRNVLTDRSKVFDIDPETLVSVNANYCNLARVQYNSLIYKNIAQGIRSNKLSALDQLAVVTDLGKLLGGVHQEESDVVGLLEIADAFASKTTVLQFTALDPLLNAIQNITFAVELINCDSNMKIINKFNQWTAKVVVALKEKLLWDVKEVDYSKLSQEELRSRNSILMLGFQIAPQEFLPLIKKLYHNLMHGPKESIPQELLNSILAGTLSIFNHQKEYKEILALAKLPSLTVNNIIKNGSYETQVRAVLQTSAVLSLGYVSQPDLVLKTLNFVMTNIDSKLIELALVGIQTQNALRPQLWDWYVLHFNQWCLKSFREGSAYAKQMKATLTNISKIVFGMMTSAKNTKKLNAFVREKMASPLYNKFDLQAILDDVKLENEEKVKLNSSNEAVLKWLSE